MAEEGHEKPEALVTIRTCGDAGNVLLRDHTPMSPHSELNPVSWINIMSR